MRLSQHCTPRTQLPHLSTTARQLEMLIVRADLFIDSQSAFLSIRFRKLLPPLFLLLSFSFWPRFQSFQRRNISSGRKPKENSVCQQIPEKMDSSVNKHVEFPPSTDNKPCNPKPMIGQRSVMIGFATLGTALMYILRYNLSVAIVAMVLPKNLHHMPPNLNHTDGNSTDTGQSRFQRSLPSSASHSTMPNASNDGQPIIRPVGTTLYDWDDNVQGLVMSSYFLG